MDFRRRKIKIHAFATWLLGSLAIIVLFIDIAIFVTSNIVANDAKNGVENMECDFCERLIAELKAEAEEAVRKAEEERIANAKGVIYLTFDDGPGADTARLLDILKAKDVKATFFVTGVGDDALIKREYDEGHTVGLHSFTHRYNVIYTSVAAYFDDLNQVATRVKNITGEDAKLIRFPGGSSNTVSARYDGGARIMSTLVNEVQNRGYQYFDWNISSGDAGGANTADEVFVNVAAHLKEGPNVVLQHDIKSYSVDAVERIIDHGLSNGYIFMPLTTSSPVTHHNVNN